LSKRYGDLVAVREASFSVERGEVVGFLGPNGAGKTTTMRMLTGFLPPSQGSVAIAGHDMQSDPIAARRAVGYLPETPPLYPEMRVDEYVSYVAGLKDVPRARRAERVDRSLAACGLEQVRRRVIGRLSRGFRQRVGLAQAIVHEPEVLILDEPTAGLDPLQIAEIRDLIKRLADEEGRTIVLSTHILPEVEAICRRVILIANGEIRLDGSLEEVRGGGRLEDVFVREAAGAAAPEAGPPQTGDVGDVGDAEGVP
jgi:ABC-2 type transport system ATP-binding protein